MTELQTVILDIFKQFKRICDENRLTYYAIGGTCLGAVRHHGFIPWDDDLDVAMPFEDYKKFQEIAETQLPVPYSLYTKAGHPHWVWNFIKLQNDDTSFFERDAMAYPDLRTGVYIDIMPLYGLPKGSVAQFAASLRNDYYQLMYRRQCLPYTRGVKKTLNCVFALLRSAYGKQSKKNDFFSNRMNAYFSKYAFDNSDKILFGFRDRIDNAKHPFSYEVVFDYCDFQSSVEHPFEDTTIPIPSGYDHYLRSEFGDYMTLPPVEKRITHNPAWMSLNQPHGTYKDGTI